MRSPFRFPLLSRATPALLSVLLGSAVLLAAPAGAAPRSDLVLGMSIEPSGLDPTIGSPVAIGQVVWQNIFEGLVRIDRDGKVQPQLAESWEISADGLTYTFHLRQGVQFHDGKPFDSAAAKFSIDKIIAPDSVNGQKALYAAIAVSAAPDAQTLVLTLKQPAGDLLYWLGFPAAVMLEPSSAETDKTDPVGTGPFRFAEWRKGDQVSMTRFDGYWGEKPALEKVTFRFIADPQAQSSALQSGGVDAFPEFGAPEMFGQFETNKAFVTEVGNTGMEVVAGMNSARKPFSDPRVRQALMLAVDRNIVIEGANSGFGTAIGSHFSPADPGYKDETGVLPYDPEKAKALLAEAGYPDGFSFTMKAPNRAYASRSAEILQALFAQVGVTMKIESSEFPAAWIQDVFKDTNYDMTIIGHAEPLDIGIYARKPYYFNYDNPAFDTAMAAVQSARDETAREAAYGQAQDILAHDVPALFLYVAPKLGVWKAGLEGLWTNEPVPSNDVTEVRWTK